MRFVMFISVFHALYFSGLWQKVENFAETLSDIITFFSFLLALIVNYWWHSLLVSCSAFPFILKDKAGIINSAIRHQVFFGWLLSQNLDTEKCFMTWKGSLQRDIYMPNTRHICVSFMCNLICKRSACKCNKW